MSFLDRFRKRDSSGQDVEADYQAESQTGKLAAVLFGFFALIITLAIAAGLFFGGRAVYRAFQGSDETNQTAEQKDQKQQNQNQAQNQQAEQETKTESNSNTNQNEPQEQSSSSSSSNRSPQTPSSGDNIPSTGDRLPATGDAGL